MEKTSQIKSVKLLVSDEKTPSVTLKQGMKLHVVSIQLVDPSHKKVPITKAALCGSSSTCIALIEIAD